MMGVTVLARGQACRDCGEPTFSDDEMKAIERQAAVALAARGVRTGKEFKYVRKVVGLQARELAMLIDVRPETISRWERDEVEIPLMAAFVLAQLLEHPRSTKEKLQKIRMTK